MATLPSGSREDVELVQVDTEDLSLVIKGKPYHERYESLKQYRTMDFHDTMDFVVDGKTESIKVYDVNENQMVEPTVLRPIFFENGVYQLLIVSKRNEELDFYHEHPLIRKAISPMNIGNQKVLMGNLQFQNEVGLTTFTVSRGSEKLLEVTLEIFPSKLDYRNDYQKLLEEVNDEIYNLAFHFIRKTYHGAKVKLDGKPSKAEFYRLIEFHFQRLFQAISNIEQQPNHHLITKHEKARGDQIGRLDSKGRSHLRKRPHLFAKVERGIPIGDHQFMPVSGLRMKKEMTYDTHENRYMKWMMARLIHKLEDLLQTIQKQHQRFPKQEEDDVLIEKIEHMINAFKKKLDQPFWRRIGKLDRSVMSLVLQMAPNYRDSFQIFLILSRGLALQGKVYQMSVKDVATLYEYWTFLKLGQLLGRRYQMVSQDILQVNRNGLYVILEANQTAKRVYKHPVTQEEIILTYQKYESSPTVAQKPDTMLSIEKKGKDYHYNFIFDAKYRIDYAQKGSYYGSRYLTPGPMEEDINTMHRYRDAIVAGQEDTYERKSFGAYVLFPWADEASYQNHYFYKSIDQVNIGGLPFLPHATTLVENFVAHLIEKSPEAIQKEGILPKGTVEEWESKLDEYVFVGLINSKKAYNRVIRRRRYTIPASKLKRGWQEASYVALYVTKGVRDKPGIYWYGKISDVSIDGEKVHFHVRVWERLRHVIKPVQYGVANYMLTTLQQLEESKELPELFMNSPEEKKLWRTLRRVSDQIIVELDDKLVDEASRVRKYKIKDIEVFIRAKEISFESGSRYEVIPLTMLKRNLSGVFRLLVEMLEE